MQLQRYMLSISSVLLMQFSIFIAFESAASEIYSVEYNEYYVTISKGADYDNISSAYNYYCDSALSTVTLTATTVSSSSETELGSTSGIKNGSCYSAIEKILPLTVFWGGGKPIYTLCLHGGTKLLGYQSSYCTNNPNFVASVKDATCTISSGDINHDYGVIISDEVDGMSMTTTATLACSGGLVGSTSIILTLNDASISLKDDDSLKATLALDGSGTSTSYDIDANSSTTLSVTSTLHTNGNVSSGAFSGSSVLTMTYY